MIKNKLLLRQLSRTFHIPHDKDVTEWLSLYSNKNITGNHHFFDLLLQLFSRISDSYDQHDRDLILRSRSLELTSLELIDANQKLRTETVRQKNALEIMRRAANKLLRVGGKQEISEDMSDLSTLEELILQMIEEREASRNELSESQKRLEMTINGVEDGVWDWLITEGRVYFSPRWYSMLGYSNQELPMEFSTWEFLLHSDDSKVAKNLLLNHLNDESKDFDIEVRMKCKNGLWKWVRSRGRVMERDENGKPIRMLGTHSDIDAQKKSEEELIIAKQVAESSSKAKSEFLANISHEIRTPMNGILGMTELAIANASNSEQLNSLNVIKDSAENLLAIINDILDYSKAEAGHFTIKETTENLYELLENIEKLVKPRVLEKGLIFSIHISENVPKHIKTDPLRLRQILLNLFSNSIKFTKSGSIDLSVVVAKQSGDLVDIEFSLRDTGIGIALKKQSLVFDSFSQADASITREYGGTGLGLAICKHLTTLLGGNIRLESREGVGSCFTFSIKSQIIREELGSTNARHSHPSSLKKQSRSLNVLLAEDALVNQKVISQFLIKLGHNVTLAENGMLAVEIYQKGNFDLILMDIQMPHLSGFEALKKIKSLEQHSSQHTPIVALTANAMKGDAQKCLAMGFDAYLSKPIVPHQFSELMESMIQRITNIATIKKAANE